MVGSNRRWRNGSHDKAGGIFGLRYAACLMGCDAICGNRWWAGADGDGIRGIHEANNCPGRFFSFGGSGTCWMGIVDL